MTRDKFYSDQSITPHISYWLASERISFCLLVASSPLLANPAGGDVVAGSASIDYGTTTIITQYSDKAIVNWQDFSINQNETTQFVQPSSQSIILNRVVGGNASQIMGNLKANGQVLLVNPNGVIFGPNSHLDVAGLIASTANINNEDFMSGNYRFSNAPDNSTIINQGHITVAQAGYAGLVAPNVQNQGIIEANLGKVSLASGTTFTVDLYGDDLITLDASALVKQGYVGNEGLIKAQGGKIMLTIAATDDLIENLINMEGYIDASTVSNQTGKIVLMGADHSTIQVAGVLDVSGKSSDETGGVIQLSGHYVTLMNGSILDASGAIGGGNINVGSNAYNHTQFIYAAQGSYITVDSISSGNAGNAIILADQSTWFYGGISAKAQGLTGHDGLVETSGLYLDVSGIDIAAGEWLIDPYNITISESSTSGGSFSGNPYTFTPTTTSTIQASDLNTALAGSANVIITTTGAGLDVGNITFSNNLTAINWSGSNSLTFLADNDIIFSVPGAIAKSSGTGVLNLRADSDSAGGGTVTFSGNTISSTGAVNIFYNPSAYTTPTNYSGNVTGVTPTAYMLINTPAQLQAVNTNTSGVYALGKTIDMTAVAFTPITSFNGNFYGNNYSIDNLTIAGAGNNIGLFTLVTGGIINNITLENANISNTGTFSYLGAVIGRMTGGTLTGTFTTSGTVTGNNTSNVGGIVGGFEGGTLSATMTNNINVTGDDSVGGVFGNVKGINAMTITTPGILTNHGNIVGGGFGTGGIIGFFELWNSAISLATFPSNLINTGTVSTAYDAAGGIFGFTQTNKVIVFSGDLINTGNIIVTATNAHYIGGILGYFYSGTAASNVTFNKIESTGLITTQGAGTFDEAIGGIGGEITRATFNDNLTYTGSISSGESLIGGLIGYAEGNIFNGTLSFTGNVGAVDYTWYVGGLIGLSILNTFNETLTNLGGSVSGDRHVGGILGFSDEDVFNDNVTNLATVSGLNATGGIIGEMRNVTNMKYAINKGDVSGELNTGGIVGRLTNSTVSFAYNEANVTGINSTGGIVGQNDANASIQNVIFAGTVTANSGSAGGIAGLNSGSISNALSIGTLDVTGASNSGAIAGNNTGTISTSYYDSRFFSTGVGTGNPGGTAYNTNLSFYTPASYTGFSFSSPADWYLSGTGYYASLTFCGSSCRALLPASPVAEASLSRNTLSQISQVIASNQANTFAEEISLPSTSYLEISTIGLSLYSDKLSSNVVNMINKTILNLGICAEAINNTILLNTDESKPGDVSKTLQNDIETVVGMIDQYYRSMPRTKNSCENENPINNLKVKSIDKEAPLSLNEATLIQIYHKKYITKKASVDLDEYKKYLYIHYNSKYQ